MKNKQERHRRLGFERIEDRLMLSVASAENFDALSPTEEIAVRIRLELTDAAGLPISTVEAGDEFTLRVYVKDERAQPLGVFGAYLDLAFDPARVQQTGEMVFGELYRNGTRFDGAEDGYFDEVGAFATFITPQLYPGYVQSLDGTLLFQAPFRAIESGPVTFQSAPADLRPFNDVLLFDDDNAISPRQIRFDRALLEVVPQPLARPTAEPASAIASPSTSDHGLLASGNVLAPPSVVLTSTLAAPRRLDNTPLEWQAGEPRLNSRIPFDLTIGGRPLVPGTTSPRGEAFLEERDRRPAVPESLWPGDGFIELELPSLEQPRDLFGGNSFWHDFSDTPFHRSAQPSDSSRAIRLTVPQPIFGRHFQRILRDDSLRPADALSANSLVGMIDIAEIAYDSIRPQVWRSPWNSLTTRALAAGDSSDAKESGEIDAEAQAIDTLFALGVELRVARSRQLAIELASDDEDAASSVSDGEDEPSAPEVDAGPPHPEETSGGARPT